jgi:superfamily II DNA or RNA helicase
MIMELRPYQNEAVDAIRNEWVQGHQKTLLVLPTGTGKTIVFSKVVEEETKDGSKALILAHRGELLDQASEKLLETSGLDSALEKAESSAIGSSEQVTVASVQTLSQHKRLTNFPSDYFKTIVVDEAHHSMSNTYQRILSHFEGANVLGVTATPDRSDQKNLGKYFDSKAYEYSLHQAIKEGYLAPVRAQMIPLELDIHSVGVSNGDYAVGEVGSALEPYLNQIALEMLNYCKGRKTVVFLPLVKTSQKFCELLNLHGIRAAEVNGNSKDRDEILADFEAGEYDVLCNSMLLTEGWDCPSVDTIVVLRPTKIRSLYQQMVGRGMRLHPGKKELLLLDFLWMTERHDLCRPSALVSKDEELAKRIDQKMMDQESGIDLLEAEVEAERDAIQEREDALARELASMRKRKSKLVDPIQYAFSISAEDLASYEPTFVWEMGPATDKQLKYLENHGIFPDAVTSCGMASMLIEKLKNRQIEGLATPKQIRFLERYGFLHVGMWAFEAASKMITRIADNRWMLPRTINAATYRP